MKQKVWLKAMTLLLVIPGVFVGGCSPAPQAPTKENLQSFAPGMNNLSAEAKAAKAKNDAIIRQKQMEAAAKKR